MTDQHRRPEGERAGIPLTVVDPARPNPMVWEDEPEAEGVFLGAPSSSPVDEALALLGAPAVQLPGEPLLPPDFSPGPRLRSVLRRLAEDLDRLARNGQRPQVIPLEELDRESRKAIGEMLGEGEVSGEVHLDGVRYRVRESVLAGIWRVDGDDGAAWLELGPVPEIIERAAGTLRPAPVRLPEAVDGVMNGLAVLAEINEHAADWDETRQENRVLNFTLLPMSPADHRLLIDVLGRAQLALESGGFGRCRVLGTRVRHVWAVQYLNALDKTILDTIEIGRIPDAVLAAPQDFEDSAIRLRELLDTFLP